MGFKLWIFDLERMELILFSGKFFALQVESLDTIADVKSRILELEKIPQNQQILLYDEKELEDDYTLASYGIHYLSWRTRPRPLIIKTRVVSFSRQVSFCEADLQPSRIYIFVRPSNSVKSCNLRKLELQVENRGTTVDAVKAKIHEEVGIPPNEQLLCFQGEPLRGDYLLQDYWIVHGSTLNLYMR